MILQAPRVSKTAENQEAAQGSAMQEKRRQSKDRKFEDHGREEKAEQRSGTRTSSQTEIKFTSVSLCTASHCGTLRLCCCDTSSLFLTVASLQIVRVVARLELTLRFLSLAQRGNCSLWATSIAHLKPQIVQRILEDADRVKLSQNKTCVSNLKENAAI